MHSHVEGAVDEVDGVALLVPLPKAVHMPCYLLDGVGGKNVHDDHSRVCTLQIETGRGRTTGTDEDHEFLRFRICKLADGVPALEISHAGVKVADGEPVCCSREGGHVQRDGPVGINDHLLTFLNDDLVELLE